MARPGFGVHMKGACIRGGGEELRSVTSIDPAGVISPVAWTAPDKAIYGTILARYLGRAVPRLSYWLTRQPKVRALMTYHWETMESCAAPAVIDDAMKKAGFAELVCEAWFDLFRSYVGQRPRL